MTKPKTGTEENERNASYWRVPKYGKCIAEEESEKKSPQTIEILMSEYEVLMTDVGLLADCRDSLARALMLNEKLIDIINNLSTANSKY